MTRTTTDFGEGKRSLGFRILKYVLLTILALLAVAVLLEGLMLTRDTHAFPMPGRMVDIGSHEMHIWCKGEGEPTVILDAGAIAFSTSWRAVLPLVAKTTRVCAFDRSGLGWSEAGPGPWDGNQAADELALLLTAEGIDEPVIYAGHSLGAMLARIFADRYPERLAGLVLIEPADPEIIIGELDEERETPINRDMPDSACGLRCPVAVIVALTGLPRWMLNRQDILNDRQLPELAVKEFVARSVRPSNIRHLVLMGRYFPRIFFQTLDNTSLGSTPVVFIYGTRSGELLGDHANMEEWRHDYEVQLAAWQRTGETSANFLGMREVPDANHLSLVTYPEHAHAVASVIREMHEYVRDQYSSGFDDHGDGQSRRSKQEQEFGLAAETSDIAGHLDGTHSDRQSEQGDGERGNCVQPDTFARTAQARVIDEWFMSWGAPPVYDSGLGTRPYVSYGTEELQALVATGDSEAMQELGTSKIWQALNGGPGMPDYLTLWDLGGEETPFRPDVDADLLESGRVDLYNAAVHGDLYALVDLSLSYSQEMVAAIRAGTLTEEQRQYLMIQAASFAKIPGSLIDGLDPNFVTTSLDFNRDQVPAETANLSRQNIVDRLENDRRSAGLDPDYRLSLPAEMEDLPTFCKQ